MSADKLFKYRQKMKKLFALLSFAVLSTVIAEEKIAYGAGEMKNPARTLYVSTAGNDRNDGKTLATAWHTIRHGARELRAGDTMLIAGGEYFESEVQINVKDKSIGFSGQCGKPGAPIRIMGMPGEKVVLRGAEFMQSPENPVKAGVYEFHLRGEPIYDKIFEVPSQIELQPVHADELVRDYPGTYYLDKPGHLLVHFAAKDQKGIYVGRSRIGLRIHGSYIHVENLNFENYYEGIYMRMNSPYDKNVAEHITVKNCGFYHNYKNGLVVDGASHSLFIGNRGMANGSYGTVMIMPQAYDNLFTGNWFGESPQTLRQLKPYDTNFALSQYGSGDGMRRNHIIGNVLDDQLSFRWKPGCPESRFEDNILTGRFYAESKPVPAVIRNNYFGGRIGWIGIGGNLWEKDFAGTPMVFNSNVRDRKDFRPENKIVFDAEKLKVTLPKAEFPKVEFRNLRAAAIENDSAAVLWETPENDGFGSVEFWIKGNGNHKRIWTKQQGVRHAVGLTGLKPNTEYEYFAAFSGRRGEWKRSVQSQFTTASKIREPGVLEVGPGKMNLEEASMAAVPGDVVKLASGRHVGQFVPIRGGLPGKPITLTGEKGAMIDGARFYAPLVDLNGKDNIIIDGITFVNPEDTTRSGVIRMENVKNITVRNCRADFPWMAGPFILCRGGVNINIENNISRGGDYPITVIGKNIKIRHNTIVDATMWSTSFWGIANLEITDNIFYRPCIQNKRNTALLLNDIKGKVVSDGNVFWSPVKEHPVGGTIRDGNAKVLNASKTLNEWQQLTGLDKNSIHADPMFADYEKGDFRLKAESPARGKGADIK